MLRIGLLIFSLLIASCSSKEQEVYEITDPSRDRSFEYEVFLPANDVKNPLLVFSHGSGGDYRNYKWLIKYLVDNGYVVATLNHPHNNARDNTNEGVVRVWDRPRDLSLLIDAVLASPKWSVHVDPNRIGAVGHSSGGYAVLALAGAIYNPDQMKAYCDSSDHGPDCDLVDRKARVDYTGASQPYMDNRVRSVVALAPAVGPAIEKNSLESISIPVLILATEDDEVLEFDKHARYYAESIPGAGMTLLEGGGHFIYMECNIITKVANWFIENLDLCGRQFHVDRVEARTKIGSIVNSYLDENLNTKSRTHSTDR